MRPACAVAGTVLNEVAAFVEPGVTTRQVDEFAAGGSSITAPEARFWVTGNTRAIFASRSTTRWCTGWPATGNCASETLSAWTSGSCTTGFVGDTAKTIAVGGCGVAAQKLMDVTEKSLYEGIAQAVPGKAGKRHFPGHSELRGKQRVQRRAGICRARGGRSMHEEPQVPNFVDGKSSPKLRPGMTIAIEPMVNAGKPGIKILNDDWTVVTQDGSLSAHFEHTVLITENEPEILTWPEKEPSRLKVS